MKNHRHKHIKSKLRYLKPKKSLFDRSVFWLALLFLVVAGGVFYLFFFFPQFQVQAITISGNQNVSSVDIQTAAWQNINKKVLGISSKSIFTVNTTQLKRSLLTGFPDLENVNVQHRWLAGIHLEITERSPVATFCASKSFEQCFLIDKNGVIYANGNPTENNLIVRQAGGQTFITGMPVIDKSSMAVITKVKDDLQNNFQIHVKEALVSNPLIFTTTEGWKLYVDPSISIDDQITKMDLLLKNTITPAVRKKLQYIYLQYKDRAYYK